MKLSPAPREEVRSSAIVHTMLLVVVCSLLFALTVYASDPGWNDPAWWAIQGAVKPTTVTTINGIVTTNYPPALNAVANQGQLKQFTFAAYNELNSALSSSGGAGLTLSNMVYGWQKEANSPANPTRPYVASDYQAVNVGQLKYIGRQVWGQLTNAGYAYSLPSWLAQTNAADYSAANLGQLKTVFNFDIVAPQTPSSLMVSLGSTQATLTWSETSTLVENYTIYESSNGGTTWSNVGTVPGNTTTTTVGSLVLGANYSFEVAASNPSGASASSAGDAPPVISLITPAGATLIP